MDAYKEVPILIPAYEPDEKLLVLLKELRAEGFAHILVVDDGSGKAYRSLFDRAEQEHGCTVLRHAVNLGKGRALKTGFNHLLQAYPEAPGCVTADSDGQHTPACIAACAGKLCQAPDSLILGCRNFDDSGVPAKSEFGNKCTRAVFRFLVGVSITDTQTGLRGIPAGFMKRLLEVKGERFEFESNMLIETKDMGVPIVEVPIQTVYLEGNKGTHFHPVRDSLRIYSVFGKFLFSGLSSSVLDLVLFSLFCGLMRNWQLPGGFSYVVPATIGARILSAIYNFSLNYRVVFQSKTSVGRSGLRYFGLALIQMALSAFLVSGLYSRIGGAEVLVKIPVDVLLFFASFLIQREFVYRR